MIAKVLGRPERDVAFLETTVKVCLGPFCRNVTRVERVLESRYVLLAIADPNRSDLKSGETRSELSPTLHGTTRRIEIPATVTLNGDEMRAIGKFSIDRDDFKVKATSAAHGMVRVSNTVKFEFDIVGRRG